MKDCVYLDYEGVCGITCKECDGSINEICKYYHKNRCAMTAMSVTMILGGEY